MSSPVSSLSPPLAVQLFLGLWARFYRNKFGLLFDRPNTSCTFLHKLLCILTMIKEGASCGNIMVICRHEELGLTLVGAILYCRIVLQAWFGWFASLNSENVDIWVFQKEPLQLLQYLQHWKSLDFPVLCQI
jgi:hypothetical protein